jgi:O-antigen/teichoic acid export membrane protein
LTAQAWYELALRICNQLRSVALFALQPLLYYGAADREGISRRYAKPQAFAGQLAALMYLGLACGSPLISFVLFGEVAAGFIVLALVLGLGFVLSVIGLPGYFGLVARGEFGRLLRFTMVGAVLNVLAGLGAYLGAGPVAGAAGLSISLGYAGICQLRWYSRLSDKGLLSYFGGFWMGGLMAVGVGVALVYAAERLAPLMAVALGVGCGILLVPPAWSLTRLILGRNAQASTL